MRNLLVVLLVMALSVSCTDEGQETEAEFWARADISVGRIIGSRLDQSVRLDFKVGGVGIEDAEVYFNGILVDSYESVPGRYMLWTWADPVPEPGEEESLLIVYSSYSTEITWNVPYAFTFSISPDLSEYDYTEPLTLVWEFTEPTSYPHIPEAVDVHIAPVVFSEVHDFWVRRSPSVDYGNSGTQYLQSGTFSEAGTRYFDVSTVDWIDLTSYGEGSVLFMYRTQSKVITLQ